MMTAFISNAYSKELNSCFSIEDNALVGSNKYEYQRASCPAKIKIAEGVEVIRYAAIYNRSLAEVEFPSTLQVIEDYAFTENNLVKVVIPSGVTYIGTYAFSSNGIGEVVLPSTLKFIGAHAFDPNVKITFMSENGSLSSEFPEGLTIGRDSLQPSVPRLAPPARPTPFGILRFD